MFDESGHPLSHHISGLWVFLCPSTTTHPFILPFTIQIYWLCVGPGKNLRAKFSFHGQTKTFRKIPLEKVTFQFKVVKKFKDEIVNFMGISHHPSIPSTCQGTPPMRSFLFLSLVNWSRLLPCLRGLVVVAADVRDKKNRKCWRSTFSKDVDFLYTAFYNILMKRK